MRALLASSGNPEPVGRLSPESSWGHRWAHQPVLLGWAWPGCPAPSDPASRPASKRVREAASALASREAETEGGIMPNCAPERELYFIICILNSFIRLPRCRLVWKTAGNERTDGRAALFLGQKPLRPHRTAFGQNAASVHGLSAGQQARACPPLPPPASLSWAPPASDSEHIGKAFWHVPASAPSPSPRVSWPLPTLSSSPRSRCPWTKSPGRRVPAPASRGPGPDSPVLFPGLLASLSLPSSSDSTNRPQEREMRHLGSPSWAEGKGAELKMQDRHVLGPTPTR